MHTYIHKDIATTRPTRPRGQHCMFACWWLIAVMSADRHPDRMIDRLIDRQTGKKT